MTKEALKMALEALEWCHGGEPCGTAEAITAIKEALAQPEQEPVARVIDNGTPEGATEWIPFTNRVEPLKTGDLLYTTTPQRTWVGLTDEDITKIDQGIYPTWKDEVQAVEARLKELNNG